MRSLALISIALSCFSLSSGRAWSASCPEPATSGKKSPPAYSRRITVGTYDIKPIIDRDEPGLGPLTQLVRAAFHAVSIETSVKWIPWKRLFSPGLEANVDALFPMGYNPGRAAHFLFSDPLMQWDRSVCFLKTRPFHWKSYRDFHDKVIAFERGSHFGPLYQYLVDRKAATFVEVNSDLSAIKLLLSERVDLFFCAPEETRAELSSLQKKGLLSAEEVGRIAFGEQTILSAPLHLTLPKFTRQGRENKKSQELLALFNSGLAQVKACTH